ncbi:MAG: hypothetical protein MK105_15645 [Crocinitomicaceae bacterium]|nr:hypothetical protein [Crocinitomicaceae bacterium]
MYSNIITITFFISLKFIGYAQDSYVYPSESEIQRINRENITLIKIRNDYLSMVDSLKLITEGNNIITNTADSLILNHQNIELDRLKQSNASLKQSLRQLVYIIDAIQFEMAKSSENNKSKQE